MKLLGYKRPVGPAGIRNHLLILPTSVCAADTAEKIAQQVPGAVALPMQHGCCQIGADYTATERTLAGFGKNANVGAVLIITLGCEGFQANALKGEIEKMKKPVEALVIQEEKGTINTESKGARIAANLSKEISKQQREEIDITDIILGLECGGSDPTSGLASNPTIGYASDKLVEAGGSSILSETTEVIGAEHLIAERFTDEQQRTRFLEMVQEMEDRTKALGQDLRKGQPTPGNIEGGLTTIEEKSLGCMYKAGISPFEGVLEYAEQIPWDKKGLYFMDTPGQDIDSITGMIAGGAQLIVFSTGRGTPTGSPIAPVIKITGNNQTFENMSDNIDINAGRIVTGEATLPEVGEELFHKMIEVCNGELTKAEMLGHKEFGIWKLGATF